MTERKGLPIGFAQVQLSRIVLYHLKEKGFDRKALRTEHLLGITAFSAEYFKIVCIWHNIHFF